MGVAHEPKAGHLVHVFGETFPLGKLTARFVDDYVEQRREEVPVSVKVVAA